MSINRQALEILFSADELTNFVSTVSGNSTVLSNALSPPNPTPSYFCINPLQSGGRRCDKDVVRCSNILVEFDDRTIEEQRRFIDQIKLPYGPLTFSGGKSLHAIVALDEDLGDRYDSYSTAIINACGSDPATKNRSRLSRTPGAINLTTNNVQAVIDIKRRISVPELDEWLKEHGQDPVKHFLAMESRSDAKKQTDGGPTFRKSRLDGGTENFYLNGAEKGKWRTRLFAATCDSLECGHSLKDAILFCGLINYEIHSSDIKDITGAFKKVFKCEPSRHDIEIALATAKDSGISYKLSPKN